MASPSQTAQSELPAHRHACSLCARRKVKCDKVDPCSNCLKAKVKCTYEAPAPYRPRKRAADEELLGRISRYEDLMRKHNVDFSQHANTWVSSGPDLEVKAAESVSQDPPIVSYPPSHNVERPHSSVNAETNLERCSWSDLPAELKCPPVQTLRHANDTLLYPTPSLQSIITCTGPELNSLHPEPRHIFLLWQRFVESVNPLTKIIHVPTLQQRVVEASFDIDGIAKPLNATLFAIYSLAITSISFTDCQAAFGEAKPTLLTRFKAAALRALIAADLLTTRDFEVLQALVLFIFADPESELMATLTAVAMRLAQKLGLHQEQSSPKLSFFEKEMHIRLWWALCGLWSRHNNAHPSSLKQSIMTVGDIRPPLSVNDADLHPNMTEAPAESHGPTEMLCVMAKIELITWVRSSSTAIKVFENIVPGDPTTRDKSSAGLQDNTIDKIKAIYHEKYIQHLDSQIPLHALTSAMIKLAISRMQFKFYHSRGRAVGRRVSMYLSPHESDLLFESAVTMLEMVDFGIRSQFSSHIFIYMTSAFQVDAYIFVLSELRRRPSGDRVTMAWKLIEDLYDERPELVDDMENTFFAALADLTIEAWDTRKSELYAPTNFQETDITPRFIQSLLDKRRHGHETGGQISHIPYSNSLYGFGPLDGVDWNWDCWGDFLL